MFKDRKNNQKQETSILENIFKVERLLPLRDKQPLILMKLDTQTIFGLFQILLAHIT